ncbi:hypothetical protein CEY16_05000 [Halalkalibacillus sediminis]|uniref:SpoOB alpha-helical domain-containing protein n=1 Tax=Halalkalibacillus sediminis TaxID=2018042 RepID=A0A2I0QXQ3_9BACI|nr:Spo0B domain-containing protein [Halalkalibacillus sediminis]PKR79112.1 hypothetical protein CEY16_05000 [Halalkalibacillus sediminis]
MKDSDVLELLRHYRHDLLNDLQLIQGFASMGKYEYSNKKIQALIKRLSSERLLQAIESQEFPLWLFNEKYTNENLTIEFYIEDIGEELKHHDHQMKRDGQALFEKLSQTPPVDVNITINENKVAYQFNKQSEEVLQKLNSVKNIEVNKLEQGLEVIYQYK